MFEQADAFRKPERFLDLLSACETGTIERRHWLCAFEACQHVDVSEVIKAGHKGAQIKNVLKTRRIDALKAYLNP